MAKIALSLLALAQLTLVHSLPAGDLQRESNDLEERAISIPSNAEPTTSYSRAIESLQSASITVLPSITGVSTAVL
jgi:endo-1,3(4)-beta-glucanase